MITYERLLAILDAVEEVLSWDYAGLIENDHNGWFYEDLEQLRKAYEAYEEVYKR